MGLFVNQNENRTELQQRIDAELRAKAAKRQKVDSDLDGSNAIDGTNYLKGTKQTTGLDWAWLIIAIAVAILFGTFIYLVNKA